MRRAPIFRRRFPAPLSCGLILATSIAAAGCYGRMGVSAGASTLAPAPPPPTRVPARAVVLAPPAPGPTAMAVLPPPPPPLAVALPALGPAPRISGKHVSHRLGRGVYQGTLVISGHHVTLEGDGPGQTIVEGGMTVSGHHNRIRGLTVVGPTRLSGKHNTIDAVEYRGKVHHRGQAKGDDGDDDGRGKKDRGKKKRGDD